MLTQPDHRNLAFLTDECLFHKWILLEYNQTVLKDSLKPGFPESSPTKGLAYWVALISTCDLFCERTPAEVDEKIFSIRPYVFASPQYYFEYADWRYRRLPVCKPQCKKHQPIARNLAPYSRFGHSHMRAPPSQISAAYIVFFRLLERHSERMGMKSPSTTWVERPARGLHSATHLMPSLYYDLEWQRNSVCQDAHNGSGLPPLTFHKRMTGFWRGELLFFDFEGYRQILSGNVHAAHTGTFHRHVAEMELEETVIRVPEDEVGGRGKLINAGFGDEDSDAELAFIRAGYGYKVLTGDELYAPEKPGWTKEILFSGRHRSGWGNARIRGRIRAWDGLVLLAIGEADQFPVGRWLLRGYVHVDGTFCGKWRDTFTPENRHGYEGPFSFLRAGDVLYPEHMPKTWEESQGVTTIDSVSAGLPPTLSQRRHSKSMSGSSQPPATANSGIRSPSQSYNGSALVGSPSELPRDTHRSPTQASQASFSSDSDRKRRFSGDDSQSRPSSRAKSEDHRFSPEGELKPLTKGFRDHHIGSNGIPSDRSRPNSLVDDGRGSYMDPRYRQPSDGDKFGYMDSKYRDMDRYRTPNSDHSPGRGPAIDYRPISGGGMDVDRTLSSRSTLANGGDYRSALADGGTPVGRRDTDGDAPSSAGHRPAGHGSYGRRASDAELSRRSRW